MFRFLTMITKKANLVLFNEKYFESYSLIHFKHYIKKNEKSEPSSMIIYTNVIYSYLKNKRVPIEKKTWTLFFLRKTFFS